MSEWIKVEHTTPDKPEIVRAAAILGIDQDAVFGKCMRFWIWADLQSVSGDDIGVTFSFIDRHVNCPGFAEALRESGWMKLRKNGNVVIPHFERHNGQTAKNRALTRERMKKLRKCDASAVTTASPEVEVEVEVHAVPAAAERVSEAKRRIAELTTWTFTWTPHYERRLSAELDRLGVDELLRAVENYRKKRRRGTSPSLIGLFGNPANEDKIGFVGHHQPEQPALDVDDDREPAWDPNRLRPGMEP